MNEDQPIDFGEEPVGGTAAALEQKYSQQMRQIVSQKIDLPISTLPEMIKDQINLNPDFQRRDRWDLDKQSRFIESIIMNVPIPPVFLGEDRIWQLRGARRQAATHSHQGILEQHVQAFRAKGLGRPERTKFQRSPEKETGPRHHAKVCPRRLSS